MGPIIRINTTYLVEIAETDLKNKLEEKKQMKEYENG